MSNLEEPSRRISRRTLLGLLGGLGLGLLARTLPGGGADPIVGLGEQLIALLSPPKPPVISINLLPKVAVGYLPQAAAYCDEFPFDPPERYPEYPYAQPVSGVPNDAYCLLREALRAWQPARFGEPSWNPFSGAIRPGDTVAIKPNLVWESGWNERLLGLVNIHPSVIRAVVDYTFKACGPSGRILICEGTATASQWPQVVRIAHLDELVRHLRGDRGVPVELVNLNDTPKDRALLVQLGERSMLAPLANRTLFDLHDNPDWHTRNLGLGSYFIAPHPLQADAVISLAKMKVHRAAGVTLAMKNLFGLIPSWDGPYGDERLKDVPHYSDMEASGGPRTLYLENDTTWRTAVDLNRVLLYSDSQGRMQKQRQRRYLAIVDGLVAAGKDMFNPNPTTLGAMVIGDEPVSVDAVASRVMGFDSRKVRSVAWALDQDQPDLGTASPSSIRIEVGGCDSLSQVNDGTRKVSPDEGAYPWRGHIEAADFEPPEVQLAQVSKGQLQALIRDNTEVAFARVLGEINGLPFAQDLLLVDGTTQDGEWNLQLPPNLSPRGSLTLEVGDPLFNVRRILVNW